MRRDEDIECKAVGRIEGATNDKPGEAE